jgi:hypothetical protein
LQRMRQHADKHPDQLKALIRAVVGSGRDAGLPLAHAISYPRQEIPARPIIPRPLAGAVFLRDHFICRYCGGKTILTSVMELVSDLYPDDFPFHRNWKGGQTHPAIIARSAVVDHVAPVSLGGVALTRQTLSPAAGRATRQRPILLSTNWPGSFGR